MINEEKVASSSYILTFFQNVQNLNTVDAQYYNVLAEIRNKHPDLERNSDVQIEDEIKSVYENIMRDLRFFIRKVYVQSLTINAAAKLSEDMTMLQAAYDDFTANGVKTEVVNNFVMAANRFLASSIMRSLLMSSQTIVEQAYSA